VAPPRIQYTASASPCQGNRLQHPSARSAILPPYSSLKLIVYPQDAHSSTGSLRIPGADCRSPSPRNSGDTLPISQPAGSAATRRPGLAADTTDWKESLDCSSDDLDLPPENRSKEHARIGKKGG